MISRFTRAALLAGLLATTVLAGCGQPAAPKAPPTTTVSPAWSAPVEHFLAFAPPERYAGATLVEANFTTSSGTLIHATAYLPADPRPGYSQEQRFYPLINMATYYGGSFETNTWMDLAHSRGGLNKTFIFGLLVSHGFAYVAASVPGTGSSSGCFSMGAEQEQKDIAEFVEHIATQPWSLGNVGMTGGNYAGTTQIMAAIQKPPHLKTIVPHASFTDLYSFYYQDGAPYRYLGAYSIPQDELENYGIEPVDLSPPSVDPAHPAPPAPPALAYPPGVIANRICPSVLEHIQEATKTYATGVQDAFWQERDLTNRLANIETSVFLVHGLKDNYAKPLQSLVWDRIPTEKVFWLQQMGSTSPLADRPDYGKVLVAWYDHYLNGTRNGVPTFLPPVQVQDQTGLWRNETRWPPAGLVNATFYLGAGTLAREPPSSGQTQMVTPPWVNEPYLVGLPGVPDPVPVHPEVPWPESPTENASSAPDAFVAKFATDPLASPLRFSGVVQLELDLSVDRPGYSHITAELWRIHDDKWEFLATGGRGLAQRDGRSHDDSPTPNQVLHVPVEFGPADCFLDVGDRLMLTLSGDNQWFHPNGNYPVFTLQHGASLTLPTLPASTVRGVNTMAMTKADPFQASPAPAPSLEVSLRRG